MFPLKIENAGRAVWRRWRLLTVLGLVLASYTLAGFFLVPRLARSAIEHYVERDLARHVAIRELTFNPFTLTAEVRGFALSEANGTPIASFELFRVGMSLRSIVNRAWTFSELRLDRPQLSVLVNSDGSLNLAKLQLAAPETKTSGMPAVRIGTFSVHDGRVAFDDRSRGKPFAATLTPIEFTLNDFRTAPDFQNVYRFEGSTLAGERLTWSGQFSVQPLGSTGRFAVANLKAATIAGYLQDALPFDLPSGSLDLDGTYRATVAANLGLEIALPTLKLRDIAIAPKGVAGAQPWISLPSVELTGTSLSLADRKLKIDRVVLDNAKLDVWRETNGEINLPLLFVPRAATVSVAAAPVAAAASGPNWSLSVGTVEVRAASVEVEDRMMQPAAKFSLAPVGVSLSGYSTEPGGELELDATMTVGGKGRVAVNGDVHLTPMSANLTLDVGDLELSALQPYVAASTEMQLTSGQFSTKGKLDFAATPAKGKPALQYAGEITVTNLATLDPSGQDFIKWERLRLVGVDYSQTPDRLAIGRVEALRPYGRVIITADQNFNVALVLRPPHAAQDGAQQQTGAAAPAPKETMPMRIGSVLIEDGSANFADFSIQPNFAAGLVALNGTVTGLSSAPDSRAEIKLTGNVDRYAPVDITGRVNLLAAVAYTDIALNFRNMELTTFNPYSGKYAGYNITKGKLTTELKYKVENRKLDAQHHIVLDQLEFGAATNSKDAVPLPVRLAVALLKDRDGVIDLNVPVNGSMDDPKFRVGPIVWQAFVNLLSKIVTAPFAALGRLFGGGEELAYIDFPAGSASLAPEQQEKLAKLAKGMSARPQLRLDIPLQTLTPADDVALSNSALEAELRPMLPSASADAQPSKEERFAALAALYEQQMGAPPVYPMPEATDADVVGSNTAFLERELRQKISLTQAARESLARARADAVQSAILDNLEVKPERVFRSERQSGKAPMGDAARMELSLE